MIHRASHDSENPFVQIARTTARDKELSWAARGMLLFLLSNADDFQVNVNHLIAAGDLERDAIYRILKKLETLGYIDRKQPQDKSGHFQKARLDIFETPCMQKPDTVSPDTVSPDTVRPDTVSPDTVSPDTENADALRIISIKNNNKRKKNNTHENKAGVCSIYDSETCVRYAQWLKDSGQGIKFPAAYGKTIHESGDQDIHIAGWLAEQEEWETKSKADEAQRAATVSREEREYALTFARQLLEQGGIREPSDSHLLIGALGYFQQFKRDDKFDGITYRQLKKFIPSALHQLDAEIINHPELVQYRDQLRQFQ